MLFEDGDSWGTNTEKVTSKKDRAGPPPQHFQNRLLTWKPLGAYNNKVPYELVKKANSPIEINSGTKNQEKKNLGKEM